MNLNSRQRILLQLLEGESSGIEISSLMRILYIYSNTNRKSCNCYHFVPYKNQMFSFEAYRDIQYSLISYIETSENRSRIIPEKKEMVQTQIRKLSAELIAEVSDIKHDSYEDPYFQESGTFQESVGRYFASGTDTSENTSNSPCDDTIYSIGYEMKSVDYFYSQLLNFGVKGILDVRRNAYSFKYGFLAQTLRMITKELNLTYTHIPELGVDTSLRKDLTQPGAYGHLFEMYELDLKNKEHLILDAAEIVSSTPTALLCFEADPEFCHRSRLSLHLACATNMSIIHI